MLSKKSLVLYMDSYIVYIWLENYIGYHNNELNMKSAELDPYSLYRMDGNGWVDGLVWLQDYNSISAGIKELPLDKAISSRRLKARTAEILDDWREIQLDGHFFRRDGKKLVLH